MLTPIILAGCGGSAASKFQTVGGAGYSFTAPAGWRVAHQSSAVTAANGKIDLLEVAHFTLEKPYRLSRFAAVSRELDAVAAGVAKQNAGRVFRRKTITVSGRKTRYYEIHYGSRATEEIAFVLVGRDEFQMLCRRPLSAPDTTCAAFFTSFALKPL